MTVKMPTMFICGHCFRSLWADCNPPAHELFPFLSLTSAGCVAKPLDQLE